MPDLEELCAPELPAALRRPLLACARGEVPANIAAMQLLIEALDPADAETAATALLSRLREPVHATEARRLQAALDVLRANPQAWETVKAVLSDVSHDDANTEPEEQIRRFARAFDRAVAASPEGSVALYALGNPELLKAATQEIADRLRDWGLLGSDRTVLDLGCGIGRFEEALAGEVEAITGIDISGEMIATARRRCAGLQNATFLQSSGRDLAAFRDGSFDLLLAVDSFPYLVQSGMALVERHVAEAARVLKVVGDLVILNFSYRGHPEQDRADIRRLAGALGFGMVREGTCEFALWDGRAFHLSKRTPV
jgi:ubiquinone/menaquinone biosynthesis C-methylase UbiE